jgi:hypothetical protein
MNRPSDITMRILNVKFRHIYAACLLKIFLKSFGRSGWRQRCFPFRFGWYRSILVGTRKTKKLNTLHCLFNVSSVNRWTATKKQPYALFAGPPLLPYMDSMSRVLWQFVLTFSKSQSPVNFIRGIFQENVQA